MKSPQSKSVRLLQEKYQENLEVMLKNLLKDETLSDITLHCRDGAVRAHRVILAASSPYFRKVFQEHPEHQVAFLLHGVAVKHLKSLVELMYRGSTQIPSDMTNKLCDIAEEFGMKGIVDENDKSLVNTSGRDTRYKGQKRVTVDFGNDPSDAQIRNSSPKCPRNSQERRISGCSDKSVKKDNLINNPWASTQSLSPPTLDSLGLVPTAIKQEPQSPVPATTSLLMTTPSAHITAEVRRRNNWAMKQRKYKCTLCPASFKRASHLTRHQLVHTGERPYACEQCDKAFSRHDKLKHHIRKAHTLEYEYVGNMIDSSTEGDFYTIGHVNMDMPSTSTDMTDERTTHVTREDLLARMKVKVETPEPETLPEEPKLSPVPKAILPKPDVAPPEPIIAATSDTSITSNAGENISGASSSVGSAAGSPVQKKGRGRPRKYPPVPRPLIKRPRGRPRLNQSVPPMQPGYKPIESAKRNDNYDITNMPFGDLEYLTKSLQMEQNSESFSEETSNSIEPSFMEPLVEIELDQNSSKKHKQETAEEEDEERETVLHHDTAGSFLQNIGLLENSNVNKMEIGECTISVSSAPP